MFDFIVFNDSFMAMSLAIGGISSLILTFCGIIFLKIRNDRERRDTEAESLVENEESN